LSFEASKKLRERLAQETWADKLVFFTKMNPKRKRGFYFSAAGGDHTWL